MMHVNAYAAMSGKSPLGPFGIERRDTGPNDVLIEIQYCGICHSDIHMARDEWGHSIFPMVPGHEIVGVVRQVGSAVTRHEVGETVGVGCFVDSCRTCAACRDGAEHFCAEVPIVTYNGHEKDGKTPTYGGYSTHIVVDENYVLKVSPRLSPAAAAPLLCAGITTYSPLRHWKVSRGSRVGVIGLGGLGHMGVKLAAAMGAEVTVLSSSEKKRDDAKRLGASDYAASSNPDTFRRLAGHFDLILNTVSAKVDYDSFTSLLARDGTMVLLGVPDGPVSIQAGALMMGRRSLSASMIGGIRETQEMLDFCAEHGIGSDIELIEIQQVNEAYERVLKSDVRYRFVIDMKSLR